MLLACFLALAAVACGGQESSQSGGEYGGSSGTKGSGADAAKSEASKAQTPKAEKTAAEGAAGEQARTTEEKTGAGAASSGGNSRGGNASGEAAELAKAEVGRKEITNMLPAGGEAPDPARPLPEDPPEGIKVFPATTNETVEGPIRYERTPPTNGNHDPLWQNCGFYERPIKDRHVVHSMDHGVVWITYRPDLPAREVDRLRPYGEKNYVVVSPYPGQDAPVVATSWRVQLELDGADDPRLGKFVRQFRASELSPLSGNRCVLGLGNPEVKPAA